MARKLSPADYDVDFWKIWEENPKELERHFAPIMWIGNKNKKETYDTHVIVSTVETEKARKSIPCKLDISYGSHEEKILDIYGTDLSPTTPTLFWVHGGYWRAGNRSWAAPIVRNSYAAGIRTIVIDYPLAPNVKMVEMCNATQESLTHAMKLFPESTFVVCGHSAGAQLLLTLFHEIPGVKPLSDSLKERVAGAIFMSAPYDMRPVLRMESVNKALQLQPHEVDEFSAVLTTHKIHPGWLIKKEKWMSFLTCTGQHDPPSLQKGAEMYATMLRDIGFTDAHSKIMPGEDHFTLVDNLIDPNSETTKTIIKFVLKATGQKNKSKL